MPQRLRHSGPARMKHKLAGIELRPGLRRYLTSKGKTTKASAFLAAIVSSCSDAIVGKTLDGTVTSWNEAATRLFGYREEEMIGESIRRLIPPERQKEEDFILSRIAARQRVEHYETIRYIRTAGRSTSPSPFRPSKTRPAP